jgi:hypothetical protein
MNRKVLYTERYSYTVGNKNERRTPADRERQGWLKKMAIKTKTKELNIEHNTNVGRIRITACEVTIITSRHYIRVCAKLKAVRLKDGKEYRRTLLSYVDEPNCLHNICWLAPENGRGRCPIWYD